MVLNGVVPKMYDTGCSIKFKSVCQRRVTGPITSDPEDEHHGNIMDDNTIVVMLVVVNLAAIVIVMGLMVLQVCCKRVNTEKEWHPWKGLVIHRGDDSAPLHEMDVELNDIPIDVKV